ncbi:MAG: 5-methyltetrahydrofolate--homocysteine methyltransferase [Cellvibrio sp.]|uniref:5-methyltetrahydrofolate--homocysteine methyltransferase n=1 Tax=Cellvibrio sp. TaxID=1965322 RepID=UPI0031B26DD6
MLNTNLLPGVSLVLISALLGGCGGSDTKIVERDPIPIEDDHDHDHDDEETTQGRLLISPKDAASVSVYDINQQKVIYQLPTSIAPSAIYASPSYRYGYVIQRLADRVDVVDGGEWQEDHGDHMHDYSADPKVMAFHTDDSRPTHFVTTDKQTIIFYDGNAETATPAKVGVFTEQNVADNGVGNWLNHSNNMHGAAQARGDYLLSSLRDPAQTSANKVAVYHAHNGFYTDEQILAETCPGLHGSAQTENQIAFGCTDGVLVVTQNGDNFTASKIANPASFTGTMRIGTVLGSHHHDEFVGIASGQFFVINTAANTITPINWAETNATPAPTAVGYGYADDDELFVILNSAGQLTILDSHDFSVKARVQAIGSNVALLPTGSRFELALTPGHVAYVSDPIANQIKQINLDEAKITSSLQLDFVPNKFVWLGIAEPTEGGHSH